MNILLEFSTINYKMWHSLAKRLKKLYPKSKFAGVVGTAPNSEHVVKFLKEQTDLKYEFLCIKHEIIAKAFDEGEIDYEELKKFEESLPHKSLWRIIAADRSLGNMFMHGVVQRDSYKNRYNTHEGILKYFSYVLKTYRSIFDNFRVDLFLPAVGMGSITVFIFEQLCRERGIPYLVPSNVRVKNIFAFSTDVQLRFAQIDKTYLQLQEGRAEMDLSCAEKLYDEIMGELRDPQYFDRKHQWFNMYKLNSLKSKTRFFISAIKSFKDMFLAWLKNKFSINSNRFYKKQSTFSSLLKDFSYLLQAQYQNYLMAKPGFCDKLEVGQKYLYYPLHINPEYSTQIMATMWIDQLHLIEQLAKSIPCDWVVCVKEHPTTLVCRARPYDFYKKIRRIPNVCLISIDTNMHELILNAQMVAVISGTSGWEAIQRGKPLITFADSFWDVLDLSRKCADIDRLSINIYEEFHRAKKISQIERKRKMVFMLAAMLKHGFEISYPQQYCYSKRGTDREYEIVGKETADALKRHIEWLTVSESTA